MNYQRVYTAFWAETKTWTEDERLLALYLLTCKHRQLEGLYSLPAAYAGYDMGWPPERVEAAEADLVARGWVERDGEWVLIVNALRFDQPNRGNAMKHAVKAVADVSIDTPIYAHFYTLARQLCPEFAQMLRTPSEGSRETLPEGSISPQEGSTPSTSNSSYNSSYNSTSSAAAVIAPQPVRDALTSAGFDPMQVDQSDGAIQAVLAEFNPPADVDWYRTGQEIRKAREAGKLRTDRPDSALRFIAKGISGFPRIDSSKQPGGPAADFSAYDAKTIREAA